MPTSSPGSESTLACTVKPYHRHALACTGTRDWPERLEDADGLLGRMERDVREHREGPTPIPKLTATDEPTRGSGIDLLVFPESERWLGVDETSWPEVMAELAGGPAAATPREPLAGRWIFVCVHAARDERCGRCGPPLLDELARRAAEEGIELTVRATSHVGGHKYAGNVLVYPEGVWYGTVTPDDAARIVREHLRDGRRVEDLYRGSMMAT